MNTLDIILWASAIGLWVWVLIEIVLSINKFRDKVNETKEKAYWAREMAESYNKSCNRRWDAFCQLEKRLDAIEKQIKRKR